MFHDLTGTRRIALRIITLLSALVVIGYWLANYFIGISKKQRNLINLILSKKRQSEIWGESEFDSYKQLLEKRISFLPIMFKSSLLYGVIELFTEYSNGKVIIVGIASAAFIYDVSLDLTKIALNIIMM